LIQEGEKERRVQIVLGVAAAPAPLPPPSAAPEPAASSAVTQPAPQPMYPVLAPQSLAPQPYVKPARRPGHALRTVGIVVGAIGLGAIGVAIIEQAAALSRAKDAKAAARSSSLSVQATTHPIYREAQTFQTVAIVSGVIGGVALITGVTMLVASLGASTTPADNAALHIDPILMPGGGGISIARAF